MDEMEKIVKLYKKLSKIQTLANGRFFRNGLVNTVWSQRNIETGKNSKFLRTYFLDNKLNNISAAFPIDISQETLNAFSITEKYRAVIRDASSDKKSRQQILEIWTNNNLTASVDLAALNVHGDVYTEAEFKAFAWSPDESKILYIAEKKPPNQEPFYKRKSEKDNETDTQPSKGDEYVYRQDWGEQMIGKYRSVVAVYDLKSDNVKILEGIPENMCPAQVTWAPDGSHIVGVAFETEPRKLGLIYCTNRPSVLFKLDFGGNYDCLSSEKKTVMCPRFSPDGKYLIWLERDAGGPHHSAMRLMRLETTDTSRKPNVVVDFVETEISTLNGKPFTGLFNANFIERCWASNNRLLLSTQQRNAYKTFMINIESGAIVEIENNEGSEEENGSQIILDVYNNQMLLCKKNFRYYDECVAAVLPNTGDEHKEQICWKSLTDRKEIEEMKNIKVEYLDMCHDNNDDIKKFSSIYLGPADGPTKETPLIVAPHGGPHGAHFNAFSLQSTLLATFGFGIVFVNFRGSAGAGKATIDFLPGRVGTADVADCIYAAKACCDRYSWLNDKRMSLIGGSHGGFLVHHLSGQYPDMFKAVVSRNPVVDIASMSVVSDIPDWCAVEAGECFTQAGPVNMELFTRMRQYSPVMFAHKVKAATYLMLGTKDLRVPMSQGLEMYHRLKANNVPVKVSVYDDNHTLSAVPNEMDHVINGALWLLKYV